MECLNLFMCWFNWCGGVFILCEKKVFEEIGGFSIDLYVFEEIEFII